MLEEAADELHHRPYGEPFRLGVAVAERDGVAVVLADGGVGEGDAVDVAREVAQGVAAVADGLGMRPVARPGLGGDGGERGQAPAQSVAEARGRPPKAPAPAREIGRVTRATCRRGRRSGRGGDRPARGRGYAARPSGPAEVPSHWGLAQTSSSAHRGTDLEQEREAFARMRTDGAAQLPRHGGRAPGGGAPAGGPPAGAAIPRIIAAAGRAMPVAARMQRPVRRAHRGQYHRTCPTPACGTSRSRAWPSTGPRACDRRSAPGRPGHDGGESPPRHPRYGAIISPLSRATAAAAPSAVRCV